MAVCVYGDMFIMLPLLSVLLDSVSFPCFLWGCILSHPTPFLSLPFLKTSHTLVVPIVCSKRTNVIDLFF